MKSEPVVTPDGRAREWPTADDLEQIGRIMHNSWQDTKRKRGFHGPFELCRTCDESREHSILGGVRCDKFHADLIPWEALPEPQKDINRHAFDAVLPFVRESLAAHCSAEDAKRIATIEAERLRLALREERDRLKAGFCDKHAPNESRRYKGCVICSRNEESALIEEVLKSFGWAHDEEAKMNLGGSQWYCVGEEERGTWATTEALNKALEDYDSLREAHKKARLSAAKEQGRAESSEAECSRLREQIRNLDAPDELWRQYDRAVDMAADAGALKTLKSAEMGLGRRLIKNFCKHRAELKAALSPGADQRTNENR